MLLFLVTKDTKCCTVYMYTVCNILWSSDKVNNLKF